MISGHRKREAHFSKDRDDIVRTAWRHAELSRNDSTGNKLIFVARNKIVDTLVVHALNDACLLFRVSTLGVA